MDHFAGLDVSVKETSICIVDNTGRIVREVKVASEPDALLLQVLGNPIYRFKRIGLEAGPLSQWLFSALAEAGLPVICVETRHMRAVLQAQINKTDRNDARGMARMMRAGLTIGRVPALARQRAFSHIVAAGEFRRLRPGHTVLHERGVDPSRGLCLVRPYGDGTFLGTLSFARSPSRCQGRAECPSKRIRRDRFPDRHQAVTSVRVFAAAS
jgi:hypothetical protein